MKISGWPKVKKKGIRGAYRHAEHSQPRHVPSVSEKDERLVRSRCRGRRTSRESNFLNVDNTVVPSEKLPLYAYPMARRQPRLNCKQEDTRTECIHLAENIPMVARRTNCPPKTFSFRVPTSFPGDFSFRRIASNYRPTRLQRFKHRPIAVDVWIHSNARTTRLWWDNRFQDLYFAIIETIKVL